MQLENMKNPPLISVCIPVFSTEPLLAQCLRSVIRQDFARFEVVIVSDASRGKDAQGRNAKKIVRVMQRECNKSRRARKLPVVPFRFVEHKQNRGLIEVRRTLCYEARADYMTQLDSDDELADGALTALYETVAQGAGSGTEFDIVHGTSVAGAFDADGTFVPAEENRYGNIFYGEVAGRDVFRRWLMEGLFTANTWGKLIRRSLWLSAYQNIPYTECNVADDVLLFFFLAQNARRYVGIKSVVYRYRVNSGMTSARKIDTLHKWKMVCSAASVFSVISTWIQEHPHALCEDEVCKMRAMTRWYLVNNLQQMRAVVVPELLADARELLCEYWGADFVQKAEAALDQ